MEMSSWSARLVGVDDDGLLNGYGRLFADGEDHAEEDEAPDVLGWPGGPFQSLKVQNGFLNRPHLQQAEAPWRQSSLLSVQSMAEEARPIKQRETCL